MRVVLDTNVLVSGLLTPFGSCADILRMVVAEELVLCVDARILVEYDAVLRRPAFGFDPDEVETLLSQLEQSAETHAARPLGGTLPDADDRPFLEVAIAAQADCLVTGNLRHFPARCRGGVRVLSPGGFLAWLRGG